MLLLCLLPSLRKNRHRTVSTQYIKSGSRNRHLQFGKVTCSVTVSRQDPSLPPTPTPRCFTKPPENSQAWKKYSYLDEGSARGTEWDNRRGIQCSVACIESDSNTAHFCRRQSNLAVMCKDTYLPGEDFSTIFLREMEISADSSVSAVYILNI